MRTADAFPVVVSLPPKNRAKSGTDFWQLSDISAKSWTVGKKYIPDRLGFTPHMKSTLAVIGQLEKPRFVTYSTDLELG